jgi:hypothetical protein
MKASCGSVVLPVWSVAFLGCSGVEPAECGAKRLGYINAPAPATLVLGASPIGAGIFHLPAFLCEDRRPSRLGQESAPWVGRASARGTPKHLESTASAG